MVYYDNTGSRIHRPALRRTPPVNGAASGADTQYILQVAAEFPRFTPDEVYAEIHFTRRRHDISQQMVRAVLA